MNAIQEQVHNDITNMLTALLAEGLSLSDYLSVNADCEYFINPDPAGRWNLEYEISHKAVILLSYLSGKVEAHASCLGRIDALITSHESPQGGQDFLAEMHSCDDAYPIDLRFHASGTYSRGGILRGLTLSQVTVSE